MITSTNWKFEDPIHYSNIEPNGELISDNWDNNIVYKTITYPESRCYTKEEIQFIIDWAKRNGIYYEY